MYTLPDIAILPPIAKKISVKIGKISYADRGVQAESRLRPPGQKQATRRLPESQKGPN